MKTYNVLIEATAEQDLREIFSYIKFSLTEPLTAQRQVQRIRSGIENLAQLPKRFPVYSSTIFSQEVRRMSINNYAVFYAVCDDSCSVSILRVIYSRRDLSGIFEAPAQ